VKSLCDGGLDNLEHGKGQGIIFIYDPVAMEPPLRTLDYDLGAQLKLRSWLKGSPIEVRENCADGKNICSGMSFKVSSVYHHEHTRAQHVQPGQLVLNIIELTVACAGESWIFWQALIILEGPKRKNWIGGLVKLNQKLFG
jgi:hypothetical protein